MATADSVRRSRMKVSSFDPIPDWFLPASASAASSEHGGSDDEPDEVLELEQREHGCGDRQDHQRPAHPLRRAHGEPRRDGTRCERGRVGRDVGVRPVGGQRTHEHEAQAERHRQGCPHATHGQVEEHSPECEPEAPGAASGVDEVDTCPDERLGEGADAQEVERGVEIGCGASRDRVVDAVGSAAAGRVDTHLGDGPNPVTDHVALGEQRHVRPLAHEPLVGHRGVVADVLVLVDRRHHLVLADLFSREDEGRQDQDEHRQQIAAPLPSRVGRRLPRPSLPWAGP